MTAYSWILKQIIADQTELLNSFFNEKIDLIEFNNNTYLHCEKTGETFKNINCHEKRINELNNKISDQEIELKKILSDKLMSKEFKLESELRKEILKISNEIENTELKINEIKQISKKNKIGLNWYLICSRELFELLKKINQPIAKSNENYWWGINEEPNEEVTELFNTLKKIVFFKNVSDENIINHISNYLTNKYFENKVYNNPHIPYWRKKGNDPYIKDSFKKLYYIIPHDFPDTIVEMEGLSFMIKNGEDL